MMHISTLGWIGLVLVLCITTFGAFWVLTFIIGTVSFLIGLVTLLHVQNGRIEGTYFHRIHFENPLSVQEARFGGLDKFVQNVKTQNRNQKFDQRITGSDVIDSSLQEIFGYIIRDYIQPWYEIISNNNEFLETGVRKSAQMLAINISNRIKEIDWLPYLTTRLVDDAATHLRLFRQARAKMKAIEKPRKSSPRDSPLRNDTNRQQSPKRSHKRNKSETDVSWYFGSRNSDKNNVENDAALNSLEEYFFDLECKMENNLICRDVVCMDPKKETEFLTELTELLLYILLPDEDFRCKSVCFLLREIFACCLARPLFNRICDPDYINQVVIWLCFRDASIPSDIFLTTLRITDNCDELKYTKEIVSKEMQQLRSRDSGGELDAVIKQQLSSLNYLIKVIDSRLAKLQDNYRSSLSNQCDISKLENLKSLNLPLDAILKNNVALSYFIDYITNIGQQAYLYFYLNVEGWKVTAEQQISNIEINKIKGINENANVVYDKIRETAYNIYEQYLSEKSPYKLQVPSSLIQTLFFRIKNLTDQPSELWFDDIQKHIYEILNKQYLPGFERSSSYLKLLAEFDLLTQSNIEEDEISLNSLENVDVSNENSNSPIPSVDSINSDESEHFYGQQSNGVQKVCKHARSYSDTTNMNTSKQPLHKTLSSSSQQQFDDIVKNGELEEMEIEDGDGDVDVDYGKLKVGNFTISVDIIETGVMCEKGKSFGIYATQVSKLYDTGYLEQWHIYRRYSDFYDLFTKIKDKFIDLRNLQFPAKKTFHNTDRVVLERRMHMLNVYMQEICKRSVVDSHVGLRPLLLTFTEQGDYDRATSGGHISQTIDTLKSGMKTIKNMPEQFINTVDGVVDGLTKVFQSKSDRVPVEASKVGASIDVETDDNIPLRIMLLLMDEVFDLKSRNQWLRRRIVTLLRQIVRTMFGDNLNRRILDYVSVITSPKNVSHYLHIFKHSFWPNGMKAEKKDERDEAIRNRTRVAAKVALLSALSDELKHIIGSDTTRRGLLTVFELFQRPVLNRRLLYVLIEGVLSTLFPEKNMTEIFQKLHSNSRRVPDQKRNKFTSVQQHQQNSR